MANYRNEIALLEKLRGRAHVIQLLDSEEVVTQAGKQLIYMVKRVSTRTPYMSVYGL